MRYSPGRRGSFGPRLTKVVAWIIGVEVACFLLYLFSGEATRGQLEAWLALTPQALARGHLWKLATTSLLNLRGLAFFFDVLMLWLFVPVLEGWYGPRRFLVFVAVTSLVGNVASALVGLALGSSEMITGLSPFIYASIAAYGVLFARQPVQFFGVIPIQGRTLALGVAVVLALFVLLEGAWVEGAGYFTAMGLAWILTSGVIAPNVWWLRLRRWRIRRRYKVIDGGGHDRPEAKKRWMN